ncbi:MAG TPA: zf-HC2 domain-containing protein [Vicinamibacterales bacterium]|nr:zf-HC2 domain-containing protein [Vicinamibacterales bacterium]
MTLHNCAAARRRLAAFHDRELPVHELIEIESHVQQCAPCSSALRDLQELGDALRLAAAAGPADDWTGLAPGVIGRMRAEAGESWPARVERIFDDLHLVWIGLASATATFVCAAAVLGMLHFASEERHDSLAAVIGGAPSGSDLNPVWLDSHIRVPTVPSDSIMWAMIPSSDADGDLLLPVSAVVTRAGRVSQLAALSNDLDRRQATEILNAISSVTLEPAQFHGSPVAVNLVWLFAHTTVKGKLAS